MGFTGLARWINPPADGLELIDSAVRARKGMPRSRWQLAVRSYRSTFQPHAPRTMQTVTLADSPHVHVLLEDPSIHAEPPSGSFQHRRTTFLTVSNPISLDMLMTQLRTLWVPVRSGSGVGGVAPGAGKNSLTIEGTVFTIGSDWIVRAGEVRLSGGGVRGIVLEYVPLPYLDAQSADGTSELLSNLLTSILPPLPDAKTVAVTISDAQWQEVLGDSVAEPNPSSKMEEDDIYFSPDTPAPTSSKGDWTGVSRDRRAAFLIVGALRSEGIL